MDLPLAKDKDVNVDLPKRARNGRIIATVAAFVAILSIAFLTLDVSREIRLLDSAQSDNVQWSLVQTEVEFLEFRKEADANPVDLAQLRQEFDIFYSRVMTLRQASVFEGLRADPTARAYLEDLIAFLDAAVVLIDAPDFELRDQLPDLRAIASSAAPAVRMLGTSGLDLFAREADAQREAVARTMMQLALAVAALIAFLTLAVVFLIRLNARIYGRERENHQTTTRMTTVMSTSLDGVIVANSDGEILQFSPAAEGIFGHLENDVLGKQIGEVIVPDHMKDAHDAGMQRMRDNGEKRVVGKGRVKLEAKHKDGRIFPVELAIQSATTDQGEIFIAFLRDISQRVAAEAELVAARDRALAGEKLKTDFLSTMSHEIRTPLNGLLGSMNLLRDTDLDPEQDRYVSHMEASGRLLLSHISDVLDITRYDAGKLSTRSEPLNISHLLQDIVDNQNGAALKNGTSLGWRWQGAPLDWVLSDHDRLQHVMMNLIGNAVKFTQNGSVDVSIENIGTVESAKLIIRIADTGPGMAPDLVDRVFDDFVTGNTAYDRNVGGTGLGLSIAKRFVHALGGEIGVDSAPGVGSTFWVSLPVTATEPPMIPRDEAQDHRPERALNVLLVEDNEINRIVAREMLQSDGHSVTEACDGAAGVSAAARQSFDLILMDISMPVMDGRAATRSIRAGSGLSAKAPIVALTANAMAEEQTEFLADGMDDILTKPLSREALRAVLFFHGKSQDRRATNVFINVSNLAETREGLGEEAFESLKLRFRTEADDLVVWLTSRTDVNLTEIAARTHKVAGSAAVFGAEEFRNALKAIETAAQQGDTDQVRTAQRELQGIWKLTESALNTY